MRLDINYKQIKKKTTHKHTPAKNTWKLDNPFLNNEQIMEEIKREIKTKFLETNNNEKMTIKNLWDTEKSVLRGSL